MTVFIKKKEAFSLVELSIVIVIIGLLVAGTLAGADLIKTAKLKSLIGEVESYKIAVDNFKQQYEELPGDMRNATSFWTTDQNGGTAVQNGNGDGEIQPSSGDKNAGLTETFYAWNHLTLAKLVPGTFSGSTATGATPGVNIPASKYMDGVGFSLRYNANPWNYTNALGRFLPANYIATGKAYAAWNIPQTNAFTAQQAYYVDSKIDDGKPASGKVIAGLGMGSGVCGSGAAPNIIYNTTQDTIGCVLFISID